MSRRTSAALCLLVIQAMLGCSGLEDSICDQRIICEGGNDRDKSACVDNYYGLSHRAAAYGCSEARHVELTCISTTGFCNNARFTSSCDAQIQALDACTSAASSPNFR